MMVHENLSLLNDEHFELLERLYGLNKDMIFALSADDLGTLLFPEEDSPLWDAMLDFDENYEPLPDTVLAEQICDILRPANIYCPFDDDGPVESRAYIDKYFSEHSGVAEEASQYKDVLSNVQNFAANHPNAAEGTYDAVTGEAIDTKDLNGLCVTFHQNLSMSDPYGTYTADDYAALCAIAKNELGAKSVNIGYFGGAAEVSFVCENQKAAVDFAIAHNQHSVYDPTEGEYGDAVVNAYYNPETNPIEGH